MVRKIGLVKVVGFVVALALAASSGTVFASPSENLAKALTFRTISYQDRSQIDYDEFARLHAFLRKTYPRVFNDLDVEVVSDHSLLIQWPGSDPSLKPILFTAHNDVVPIEPGTEQDWTHPPFDGVIADGNIYGRGTLDDKGGVIGLLEAAEALLAEGFAPRRGIVLAFGHDEEISGLEGASGLSARMKERGMHFLWMVDEGGMVIEDNPLLPGRPMVMVPLAEKSYVTLTLVATGPGGHSSRPPPESTIGRLSAALVKVEQNPYPPRLSGPVRAMLEAIAPYADQPNRFFLGNLWLTDSLVAGQMAADPMTSSFVRTTTALTMFNAGVKENVVPQRAEAKINFRLLPGDTAESVAERVRQLIDDPTIEVSYERWIAAPPVADPEGPGFKVIAEAALLEYDDAVVAPSLLPGATDTRHYGDRADDHYRFHGISITAAQSGSIHGTDEYVSVESFERSVEIAKRMMTLGAQ